MSRAKSAVLHRLHGTWNATRHTARKEPKAAGPLPEPPADLTEAEAAIWRYSVEHAPQGALAAIDLVVLRTYCETKCRYDQLLASQRTLDQRAGLPALVKSPRGALVLSPYIRAIDRLVLLLIKLSSELAFSPASRAGIGAAAARAEDVDEAYWLELEAMRTRAANRG